MIYLVTTQTYELRPIEARFVSPQSIELPTGERWRAETTKYKAFESEAEAKDAARALWTARIESIRIKAAKQIAEIEAAIQKLEQ